MPPRRHGDEREQAAPEAQIQAFRFDDDPEGPLRLEGLVLDGTGAPVPDAVIAISSNPPRTVRTGEDGTFYVDELVGRTYSVSARRGSERAGPVAHLLTETSEPVVLRLEKGTQVVVEVVDDRGRAMAGASVELRAMPEQARRTDADGVARFAGVSPGWHWTVASAGNRAPGRTAVQIPTGAETIRARVVLERGASVSGTVVDAEGKPVEGARVAAFPASKLLNGIDIRKDGSTTDEQGRFAIPAVAPGSYRFMAVAESRPPAQTEPMSVGDTELSGVEIQLSPSAVLRGTVRDADGAAVPWATVRVQVRAASGPGFASTPRQATADDSGGFELAGLPRKKVVALARSERASSELVEVDLSEDPEQSIDIALSLSGAIAGRVVDSSGEPVADAQVVGWPDFWKGNRSEGFQLRGGSSVRSDQGGYFRLAGLPPGTYRVRASRTASSPFTWQASGVEAKVGDQDVHIVLDRAGGIRGRLAHAGGGHPETFTVISGLPPGVPVVSEDGEFELGDMPAGTYDVTFRGSDFEERTVRGVVVESGRVTDLRSITVQRGRVLRGRVLDASGQPVEGATVVAGVQVIGDGKTVVSAFGAGNEQAQKIRQDTTDDSGRYRLVGIGERDLVAVAEHRTRGRSLGVAVPGQPGDSQLDLRLLPFGGVRGTVRVGGEPTAGVQVVATSLQGDADHMNVVLTGPDGTYVFESLAATEYRLRAMAGAGLGSAQSGSAEARVPGGQQARVDIDIDVGEIKAILSILGKGGETIDAAQVFLFPGEVSASTGQEIHDAFVQAGGGVQMTFARAGARAEFDEVVPGSHSACVIPINGDLSDPTFQKRLNEHRMSLAVYCRDVLVADGPAEQSFEVVVPPMTPFEEAPVE